MKKLTLIFTVLFLFSVKFSYSQAYDFDLQDINGNSVKLSEMLKKGPVFLQFWATWCIPCKEEMKHLNELWEKYKDSGFVYISISTDDQKSSSKVKPFIESKGYKFITVYDPDKTVFTSYGGQDPPYSVFLNKSGNVIKTYSGYIQGDDLKLEEDIKNALSAEKK
jgi:cytochrome c biogenesis protein CcmG, thiol:disulfide interchange protein DsbE